MTLSKFNSAIVTSLTQTDIDRKEINFFGNILPLNDAASVGDVIRIPIPAGRYRIEEPDDDSS